VLKNGFFWSIVGIMINKFGLPKKVYLQKRDIEIAKVMPWWLKVADKLVSRWKSNWERKDLRERHSSYWWDVGAGR
jgi:hypothetical protein